MPAPAQSWTAVATTRMSGISQSMVSRWSGRYITPISPRPTVRATCHRIFRCAISLSRRASRSSAGSCCFSSGSSDLVAGRTVPAYPAFSTAPVSCSSVISPGSYWTVAVSVARLTEASTTPSTRDRAFCTRPTQEAQVMPSMSRVVPTCVLVMARSLAVGGTPGGYLFAEPNIPLWGM